MDNRPEKKDYEDYLAHLERRAQNRSFEKPIVRSAASGETAKTRKRKLAVYRAFLLRIISVILCLTLIIILFVFLVKSCNSKEKKAEAKSEDKTASVVTDEVKKPSFYAKKDETFSEVGEDIVSKSVIFINTGENRIVTGRNMYEKMYPASTTKIMTLLVAVENVTDLSDTFTMTYQITDPLYKAGATVAGFSEGEILTVNDLLYGTILPSGGDAAIGLAEKISGSEQEFVKLMNKKAKELNLSSTHFANCTGLFDKENYTTAYDLAVILRAAMDNKTCKKILSTYKYTTSKTEKHPDGIELENTLFKYMYGTEPENAVILGGKTGFVSESGYCIASFGEDKDGKEYVCVGLNAVSRWPAVYDQINIYKNYTKGE